MNPTQTRRRAFTGILAALVLAALVVVPNAQARSTASPPSVRPDGPPTVDGMTVLAGSLHDHTTDSDGDTASNVVAEWLRIHHDELGLDFLTFTEHSDLFPLSYGRTDAPLSPWRRSLEVTRANTIAGFTMLRGFEHTNDQENHLNVIESTHWLAHHDELTMDVFYRWLTTPALPDPTGEGVGGGGADGVGQFNHPSSKGPLNWDDYRYDAAAAEQMATIEIREGAAGWYWYGLAKGWTLGPVENFDYHDWTADHVLGDGAPDQPGAGCRQTAGNQYLGCQRTLVIAAANDRASILDALRHRRTTATERPDLWATLRGPGGEWQGDTINADLGSTITLTVDADGGATPIDRVEIVTDGTLTDLVTYNGSNDPLSRCFPTAEDPTNNCGQHVAGYLDQERRFQTSGGNATRKGSIDTTPPGTIAATRAWPRGAPAVRVQVRVPDRPSTRPDGKHFFYAVVWRADGTRAVTAPVFTTVAV